MNPTKTKIDLYLLQSEIKNYQHYRFWTVLTTFISTVLLLSTIMMYQKPLKIGKMVNFNISEFNLTILISLFGALLALSVVLIIAFSIEINDHQETIQNETIKQQINH